MDKAQIPVITRNWTCRLSAGFPTICLIEDRCQDFESEADYTRLRKTDKVRIFTWSGH